MQPKTKYAIAVTLLTLLVFLIRMSMSYQVAEPSYDSYFTLIQAESIRETGLPRYHDDFSYQGRDYVFTPGFYYVFAFFTLFLSETAAVKIVPNLFLAALVPLLYFIAVSLVKKRLVSLVVAVLGAFSPILFTSHLNTATPNSLALPLLAALLWALLNLEHHPRLTLVLTVLLALVSPWVWLLLPTYLVYLAILTAERLNPDTIYLEAGFFTFLFATWFTLVVYKQALFRHGLDILAQSLPATVRVVVYSEFTFLAMVYAVGVIPIFLGSVALYSNTFDVRSKRLFLIASYALVALLAAVTQFIPLRDVLLNLSLAFIIMAAPGLQYMMTYLGKTRMPRLANWVAAALLLFFILTSALPALTTFYPTSSPTAAELEAMTWVATLPENATILAPPQTGFLINHLGQRAYVADTNYLLISNPDEILSDIDTMYTSLSTVGVVELSSKYGITHVMIGPTANDAYSSLGAIVENEECFPLVYSNSQVLIHAMTCELIT